MSLGGTMRTKDALGKSSVKAKIVIITNYFTISLKMKRKRGGLNTVLRESVGS